MGRARCGNCSWCIKPKNGNLLCSKDKLPTNKDGCCYNYDQHIYLILARVLFMVIGIMAGIIATVLCIHNHGF